jgi:hypothetical protein
MAKTLYVVIEHFKGGDAVHAVMTSAEAAETIRPRL